MTPGGIDSAGTKARDHRQGFKRPSAYLSVIACGETAEAWPIEVAWAFDEGPTRGMLLRPAKPWSLMGWDKTSETAHRLTLEKLLGDGKEALDACLVLNAALGQAIVHSAAPETDSYWLFKLYRAGEVEPNFTLQPLMGAPVCNARAQTRVEALRSYKQRPAT
jgi:hypothetical protein